MARCSVVGKTPNRNQPVMKDQNPAVMKTIRIGLFVGKRIRRKRASAQKRKQMQQVQALLRTARSLIMLRPRSLSSCIALLPQISAFLGEKGAQPALA